MRVIVLAALSTLLAATAASAQTTIETMTVRRLDDSQVTAYVERSDTPVKQSLLVILPGSQCESVAPAGTDRMRFSPPPGMARLDIEKYGVTPETAGGGAKPCPAPYLAHNTIDQRVIDVLSVVAHLRTEAPWWDGRLFLMGASEGATVAAVSGPLLAETRGIVLINGSIGRPFRDGWADAMANAVKAQGGSDADQAGARAEAEAIWEKARGNPSPKETAFGDSNTLMWWRSIIDIRPSNLLLLTKAPVLLMQAERDEMTPVASARAVEAQFKAAGKTNLTYVELPGLSHGLRKPDGSPGFGGVLETVAAWLGRQQTAPRS